EFAQRTHDRIERFPTSGGAPGPAVHNQLIRILGDIRIEIVHQHPHRGFLVPPFACALATARRVDYSFPAHAFLLSPSKSPRRIASATRAISPESARSGVSAAQKSRTVANARPTPTPPATGLRCPS